jgi:solute:Na+ symporter, SSS family
VLLALFVLVAIQLAVGFWAAGRIRNEDDFLVAGRRLSPLLAAGSLFATWFGAESCLGAAGEAYARGVSPLTTEPFAYGCCLILMGIFFAQSFWQRRITTLADFFRQRFGPRPERLAAILLLPSSLLWAAAQVRAFGHIVATNSSGELSLELGIAIAAAVAVVYTMSGGLLADVYTDLLQGGLLILGLAALAIAVYGQWQTLPAAPASIAPGEPAAAPTFWAIVESWAKPICGSIVAQEALSRALAARSATVARNAAIGGGALYILVGIIPLTIGALGPRLLPNLADGEEILPRLAQTLLHPLGNLLFAGALIAAILSTVDSCLLVVSSIVVRNLSSARTPSPTPLARAAADPLPTAPPDRLRLARVAVLFAGLGAYFLARSDWNVHDLVAEASGFGSAGVFLLAVLGTYTRRGGELTAVSTLLAGLVGWIACRWLLADRIPHPYLASLGAAATALAVGLVCEHRRARGGRPSGA